MSYRMVRWALALSVATRSVAVAAEPRDQLAKMRQDTIRVALSGDRTPIAEVHVNPRTESTGVCQIGPIEAAVDSDWTTLEFGTRTHAALTVWDIPRGSLVISQVPALASLPFASQLDETAVVVELLDTPRGVLIEPAGSRVVEAALSHCVPELGVWEAAFLVVRDERSRTRRYALAAVFFSWMASSWPNDSLGSRPESLETDDRTVQAFGYAIRRCARRRSACAASSEQFTVSRDPAP